MGKKKRKQGTENWSILWYDWNDSYPKHTHSLPRHVEETLLKFILLSKSKWDKLIYRFGQFVARLVVRNRSNLLNAVDKIHLAGKQGVVGVDAVEPNQNFFKDLRHQHHEPQY